MKIYLVVESDYDYTDIICGWFDKDEAEAHKDELNVNRKLSTYSAHLFSVEEVEVK